MIDWLQAVFEIPHDFQIQGGMVMGLDDDGGEEWRRVKGVSVEGSHSSKILIASQNQITETKWRDVYISGNPLKFLQGHNLFGSDDVLGLAAGMARKALLHCGVFVPQHIYDGWCRGEGISIKMLDITFMWRLPCQADARAWLRSMSINSHMRHRGRGEFQNGTLYYGKRSGRWALKFYAKRDELDSKKKGHTLPRSFDSFDWRMDKKRLMVWVDGMVRGELRIFNRELKRRGLDNSKVWLSLSTWDIYKPFVEGLEVAENKVDDDLMLSKLDGARLKAYLQWRNGDDLRSTLKKTTFYRLRRDLLNHGVDISVAPVDIDQRKTNVVPMVRVLEAIPCGTPDFAKGRRVLFETERDKKAHFLRAI